MPESGDEWMRNKGTSSSIYTGPRCILPLQLMKQVQVGLGTFYNIILLYLAPTNFTLQVKPTWAEFTLWLSPAWPTWPIGFNNKSLTSVQVSITYLTFTEGLEYNKNTVWSYNIFNNPIDHVERFFIRPSFDFIPLEELEVWWAINTLGSNTCPSTKFSGDLGGDITCSAPPP